MTAKALNQAFVLSRDLAVLQYSSGKSARLPSVFPCIWLLFHVYILPGPWHSNVLCERVEMYSQPSVYVSWDHFRLSLFFGNALLIGLHWLGGLTNSWRLLLMTSLFTVGSDMGSVYRKVCLVTLHLEMMMFRMKHLILYFFKQKKCNNTLSVKSKWYWKWFRNDFIM